MVITSVRKFLDLLYIYNGNWSIQRNNFSIDSTDIKGIMIVQYDRSINNTVLCMRILAESLDQGML